jgi:hypothetical protein
LLGVGFIMTLRRCAPTAAGTRISAAASASSAASFGTVAAVRPHSVRGTEFEVRFVLAGDVWPDPDEH